MILRKCPACGKLKSGDQFYASRWKGEQRGCGSCKDCVRAQARRRYKENHDEYLTKARKRNARYSERRSTSARIRHLKRNYGLTLREYETMLTEQGGVCAICQKPEVAAGRGGKMKSLSVDHSHATGKVRRLLCLRCNLAVAMLECTPWIASSVFDYLRRYGSKDDNSR